MRLIGLAVALTLSLVLAQLVAEAQQPEKVARIGVLHPGAPATSKHFAATFDKACESLGICRVKTSWWNAGSLKQRPSGYPTSPPSWCA
jgi:hypothetical protein